MDFDFIKKLGVHNNGLVLSYTKDHENLELIVESGDSTGLSFTISDQRNLWDPDTYNLIIRKEYHIDNPIFMFNDNGVCGKSGVVGLAMIWSCKGTNSRGVVPIASIRSDANKHSSYIFEYTFQAGTARNIIELELIAYLKRPGDKKVKNSYAEIEGLTLGTLDTVKIIIDGTGSVFPIVTVNEPSQPLWWVHMNFSDPTTEPFSSEYIAIKINKAHKDYKKLETESGVRGNPLLVEIMASGVQIMVNEIKKTQFWANTINKEQIEPGSISEALAYIIDTYGVKGLPDDQFARVLRMQLG